MDRNSILGIILIVAILFGYTWYTMPSAEEKARIEHEQDSLANIELEKRAREAEKALQATAAPSVADSNVVATAGVATLSATDTTLNDSLREAQALLRFGIFHPASEGKAEEVVIENERLQVSISTHGARPSLIRLKEYQTHSKTPLILADPDSGVYEFKFFARDVDVSTRDLFFTAERLGTDGVRLRAATTNPTKYLQVTYQLDTTSYFMNVKAEFVDLEAEVDPGNLFFRWEIAGLNNEKYLPAEMQKCGVYYKYFSADRDYLKETAADEKKLDGRTNWIAFKQDFFTIALVSD
ncbi:MAG TPA: YidC/Oxa1 family insertase periplasmic-domain containing protein, partial [Flavobacteriales bacterium]|nr:YidC/Oxa1 family insertase periplasmic-domain containing protein [Flavobacteriales bacterium]